MIRTDLRHKRTIHQIWSTEERTIMLPKKSFANWLQIFLRNTFPLCAPSKKDVSKILSGPSETVSHRGAEPALAFLTVPFYRKVSVSHFRFCHALRCPDFTLFLPCECKCGELQTKIKLKETIAFCVLWKRPFSSHANMTLIFKAAVCLP